MASTTGSPVRTAEISITLDGAPTSVIASLYADRLMFIVSQLGTLGTIVHSQKETVLGGGSTFATSILIGARDDPLPELCARQLIDRLSQSGCDLPILLCLGLKRAADGERDPAYQRDLVKAVVEACLANPIWQESGRFGDN